MNEPVLFGLPLDLAFFYFIVYSVLGWCMETIYCSVVEKCFVPRGFLYGPLCPIYGVGVLMMICWFQPLMNRPVIFYLTATVCMSAWEYFVGWFLETTTHIKYWDYSMFKFNLKGRICLMVSLTWGILSYAVLYFIHPWVAELVGRIDSALRYALDGFFLGVLTFDAAATIFQLVRTSRLLGKLQQVGDELKGLLAEAKESIVGQLEDLLPDQLDEWGRALKARYDELTVRTEQVSRRFRFTYRHMRGAGSSFAPMESVKRRGERLKEHINELRRQMTEHKK